MPDFPEIRKNVFYNTMLGAGMLGVEAVIVHRSTLAQDEEPPTVWCKRTNPRSNFVRQQEFIEADEQVVLLRFGKDESHEKGGIATPLHGLTVIRQDGSKWQFNGPITEPTDYSHTLEFKRVTQVGAHG